MYERMPIGVMSWGEEMPLWLFTRIAELMIDIGEIQKMTRGGLRFMFICTEALKSCVQELTYNVDHHVMNMRMVEMVEKIVICLPNLRIIKRC